MIVIDADAINLPGGSFCGSDNFHGTWASLERPRAVPPSSGITVDANYNTRNNEIILLRAAREPADFLENFFNRACERNAFINDGTTLREELGSWD